MSRVVIDKSFLPKSLHLLLLIFLLHFSYSIATEEVNCEKIYNTGKIKYCILDSWTTIDTDNVTIGNRMQKEFNTFQLNHNRRISFLPIKIYEKMPNLESYLAVECSITQIFKKNFEKLDRLVNLYLSGNQIEKIPSNTFEDLLEIEEILLGIFCLIFF